MTISGVLGNRFALATIVSLLSITSAPAASETNSFPEVIKIEGVAQNPEGIEYDKDDQSFFLSSLNAGPIIKVNFDGTFDAFSSGEPFPLSTAGLQLDYARNRLLVAGFNGMELQDDDPATKGIANLRIYNLKTGVLDQDINLSSLIPEAHAYFANDVAVDNNGNVYVSDWYAGLVYKVDAGGNPSVFWRNNTAVSGGPNGLDFHPEGYLLVSLLSVNDKGLYADYGLAKIPVADPDKAEIVKTPESGFTGFDGMVINAQGNVIGVTNNGKMPGGNTLIELSGIDSWRAAKVVATETISASTTVAVTPDRKNYVINQDFSDNFAETWTIQEIKFKPSK